MSLAVKTSRPHFNELVNFTIYVIELILNLIQELINISFDNNFSVTLQVRLSLLALCEELKQTVPSLTQVHLQLKQRELNAKLLKSLYNPTFTTIFVQTLYQYRILTKLSVLLLIITPSYEICHH